MVEFTYVDSSEIATDCKSHFLLGSWQRSWSGRNNKRESNSILYSSPHLLCSLLVYIHRIKRLEGHTPTVHTVVIFKYKIMGDFYFLSLIFLYFTIYYDKYIALLSLRNGCLFLNVLLNSMRETRKRLFCVSMNFLHIGAPVDNTSSVRAHHLPMTSHCLWRWRGV